MKKLSYSTITILAALSAMGCGNKSADGASSSTAPPNPRVNAPAGSPPPDMAGPSKAAADAADGK